MCIRDSCSGEWLGAFGLTEPGAGTDAQGQPVSYTHLSAKHPLFTVEERVAMLQECCKNIPNVTVESFDGLTVEFAKKRHASVMVRGLRAVTDFENAVSYTHLVIIGVTNVIPFFGPFIGAIPATLLILIQSPIKALWFVLFVLVLQQLDGNIIGPKILGNTTGLSSFWVLFAILLFGGLWGFVGMIVGVPDVYKRQASYGLRG